MTADGATVAKQRQKLCGARVVACGLNCDLVRQIATPDFAFEQARAFVVRALDDDDLFRRRELKVNRAERVAEGGRVTLDGIADEAQDVYGLPPVDLIPGQD